MSLELSQGFSSEFLWIGILAGIVLFVLTNWMDGSEVEQLTERMETYSSEAERHLWVRIAVRQCAALALTLMLDVMFARIAESEPLSPIQTGRFFLGMAEAANLLRVPYYHRQLRDVAQRAIVFQPWRSARNSHDPNNPQNHNP
jgi:hypothetical protein